MADQSMTPMDDLTLTITADEQHACRRGALLLRALAKGLEEIGTAKESAECATCAATLDLLVASTERVTLSPEQKIDVEQAAFLLEGIRNGLDNSDLDEAADAIERDIERLNDIVLRYNTGAGRTAD
jgi:recombinational DNA repair protein (RecF pathway)